MADVAIADPSKTIVFDDRNSSRGYGPSWSAEPTFGQTANAINVGDKAAHILNAVLTGFGFVREGIARVGSDVRDSAHMVDKSVCDARDATRQEGTATRERIQTEGRGLSEGQGTIRREIAVEAANVRKDICDVRDTVRTEACLTREVIKDRTDQLARQELEHFAALRLQASENTARLSKELADCCCEMKLLAKDALIANLQERNSEISQQGLVNAIVSALNNKP